MAYCWAALRTLAFVFGIVALFGHQLVRVSKTFSTQRVGRLARNCSGAVTLIALASSAIGYGYLAVKDSRQVAEHGPWEQYASKKPNPFDQFDTPPQRGGTPGIFDDLIPKQIGARTGDATPNCDDELVSAYRASRVEAAAVPAPPPGYVLDTPASQVGRKVTTRPCLVPVDGDPYAGFNTKTSRIFRFGSGWEIRAPADTRDQDVLRVFDALPANAVLPVKSP
jgi:hypothetical protein